MAIQRLYPVAPKILMPQIDAFVQDAKGIEGVEQIILFGSLVHEKMTEASDIDIAVIFSTRENAVNQKSTLRKIKNKTISWPCDLFICDRAWYNQRRTFGGICMNIDCQGKILYPLPATRDDNGTQR